jgi:hypothetical protein
MSYNCTALPKSTATDDIVDDVKVLKTKLKKLMLNVAAKEVTTV